MAIYPYPTRLKRHIHMADGTGRDSRPTRLEVAEIEQRFVRALSPIARHLQSMRTPRELTLEILIRLHPHRLRT